MMKQTLPLWALLPCIVGLACGGPEPPSTISDNARAGFVARTTDASIESIPVTVTPPTPLILTAKITYGEDRFSKISSPLQGRVKEVRAKLGDYVQAGDVLLVIDSPDIAVAYTDYVKEISELGLAKRNYGLAKDLYAVQAIPHRR